MRISDWSSDVCSSDLPPPLKDTQSALLCAAAHRHSRATSGGADGLGDVALPARQILSRDPRLRGDRKRVVWGKRVSVRVNLGGRRIIKKKKRQDKTYRRSTRTTMKALTTRDNI